LRRQNIDYSDKQLFKGDGKKFLKDLSNPIIDSCLAIYETIDEELENTEKELKCEGRKYEEVQLLNSIPGVGIYSDTMIFEEIADIERFSSEEKLFSYAGLVPSVHQSGESNYHGRLSKKCNNYLQLILVQCVQQHIRYCSESKISSFYRKLQKKKPNNVAKIATARKLLQVIYHILKNGDEFRVNG